MKSSQFTRVALVCLDPVSGFGRDLRGRHDDAVVTELKHAAGENEPGGPGFVDDRDSRLFDAELLADLEEAALDRKVGSTPLAVGLRFRSVGEGGGDNDGVFVDVESEI